MKHGIITHKSIMKPVNSTLFVLPNLCRTPKRKLKTKIQKLRKSKDSNSRRTKQRKESRFLFQKIMERKL